MPEEQRSGEVYRPSGDWTLARIPPDAPPPAWRSGGEGGVHEVMPAHFTRLDFSGLGRLDSAGAVRLLQMLPSSALEAVSEHIEHIAPRQLAFVEAVARALHAGCPPRRHPPSLYALMERTGRWMVAAWQPGILLLSFVGQVLITFVRVVVHPARLRFTSVVYHMEAVGLDAVPIVSTLSFMVGAVVAFLGATILKDYGAEVFTVQLVSYSFLREFGIVLSAILLAGRSGSAFTAQIGAMKSNEEIDALRTIGVDPVEVLVVPRLIAMLIMLPILTLLAMIMGIAGGALALIGTIDLTPGAFTARLQETTELRHFWVGISKSPVFAYIIATVGCLEGLKVSGSAESVGRHTTSSVVQSIFLVIIFDALFAVYFIEVGL